MGFWRRKRGEYEQMYQIIAQEPGITPAELARRLNVDRATVHRRLPSLEEAGYLLSEDERGGLWPFRRIRR